MNYIKQHLLIISLLCMTCIACSGESLIDGQTNPDETPAGAPLTLNITHHPTPIAGSFEGLLADAGALTREFNTSGDYNYNIVLEEAGLSWQSIEVFADDSDDCPEVVHTEFLVQGLYNILVDDLSETVLDEGTLPNGDYCQYALNLGPVQAFAEPQTLLQAHQAHEAEPAAGADESPNDFVHGNTAYTARFVLTWTQGVISDRITIIITDPITVTKNFQAMMMDGTRMDHPLHAHEDGTALTVLFGLYHDQLFNGVDFKNADEATIRNQVTINLGQVLHQHLHQHQS